MHIPNFSWYHYQVYCGPGASLSYINGHIMITCIWGKLLSLYQPVQEGQGQLAKNEELLLAISLVSIIIPGISCSQRFGRYHSLKKKASMPTLERLTLNSGTRSLLNLINWFPAATKTHHPPASWRSVGESSRSQSTCCNSHLLLGQSGCIKQQRFQSRTQYKTEAEMQSSNHQVLPIATFFIAFR